MITRFVAEAILVLSTARVYAAVAADNEWIKNAGGGFVRNAGGDIVEVDLRSSWATDSDMPQLAALPALRKLDLSHTRISDAGMRALRRAPRIEELNLHFAEQISDEGMAAIREWRHLKNLSVRGTRITDATLEHIAGLPALEKLDIGYAQLTDSGLTHLTSLANLRELSAGGNKLAGPGLQFLRQLPALTYLDLGGSQRTDSGLWSITVSEEGLEAVATISALKELRLAGSAISASGLKILRDLKNLERLDLQNCKRVSDDAIPVLMEFRQLRALDLHGTSVTEQGFEKLAAALPACKILR